MYCPNCGTKNPNTAAFCMECGQSLAHVPPILPAKPTHQTEKVGAGFYRFVKAIFYIFYAIMIILVPAVVWVASESRVCQPATYNSYGQITLGQCTNTSSGAVEFGHAFIAFGITWIVLELIKSVGIYIVHGTKFKDQNTFFMQAMREDHKKKRA